MIGLSTAQAVGGIALLLGIVTVGCSSDVSADDFERLQNRVAVLESQPTDTQAELQAMEASIRKDINRLSTDVAANRRGIQERGTIEMMRELGDLITAINTVLQSHKAVLDDYSAALARMANGLSLLSLITNYGGSQSSKSAAGDACFAWYFNGQGSVTDCGWRRTD